MNTRRATRFYDHRLVRAVQTSRDTSVALRMGMTASAARLDPRTTPRLLPRLRRAPPA